MELTTHHDKIINTFNKIGSREKNRASEAGEDREEIGKMLELTGLNKKAVAFCRSLHKMEDDKREDVLRSLHPLLTEMGKNWDGQKTPDMFGANEPPALDHDDGADDGALASPSYAATLDVEDGDDEIAAEADDFDRALAEVSP